MGELLSVRKIDFAFDFATTNLSAGAATETGDTNVTDSYELSNDSVMELAGIELIGPVTTDGVRQKLESIKIKIDGSIVDDIVFNELMAPPYHPNTRNELVFHDGALCFNLGRPLLMGGNPANLEGLCPKIGPGQTLGFEVKAPRTAENGATVDEDMIIRATVVEAKGEATLTRTLDAYGLLAGGNVEQGFTIHDLSTDRTIEVTKTVEATQDAWTSLHGGKAAAKPYATNFITYAQNGSATTTNSDYRFLTSNDRVMHDFMQLYWNFTEKDALRLTHMGVLTHENLGYVRVYIDGRDTPGNDWQVANEDENMFPMPLNPDATTYMFKGPAPLLRPETIYNDKAYIEIKDTGTAVPAWASGVSGAMVAVWGKRIRLA